MKLENGFFRHHRQLPFPERSPGSPWPTSMLLFYLAVRSNRKVAEYRNQHLYIVNGEESERFYILNLVAK